MKDPKKLLILAEHWHCVHGHRGTEHPTCWDEFVANTENDFRIGYFDIEATNLDADFGVLLSYAFKIKGKDTILSNVIQQKDIDALRLDKPLVAQCIDDMLKFDMVVTYYGCLTEGNRVLTSDLRWVPIEELKKGDRLVGFDATHEAGKRRQWRESIVTSTESLIKEVAEVTFTDGTRITASLDHPWLKWTDSGYDWATTSDLQKDIVYSHYSNVSLPKWFKMPPSNVDYKLGWLSAFFESEGTLSQSKTHGFADHYGLGLSATQNQNVVLERAKDYLEEFKFERGIHLYDPSNEKVRNITVNGTDTDKLSFLAMTNAQRLIKRLDISKLGAIREAKDRKNLAIAKIVPIGKKTVIGLGTSTQTYIAEGFPMHNTGYDIPFMRTRALKWGLPFPEYGAIIHHDLYYVAKSKLKLSRNRLENVGSLLGLDGLKTHLDPDIWTQALLSPKARDYIQDHNKRDVILLEKAHERLIPYIKGLRKSI